MAKNEFNHSGTTNQDDTLSSLLTNKDNAQTEITDLIAAGVQLLLIKESEPHGGFINQLSMLGISMSSARNAMRVAIKFSGDAPRATIARTGISKTKLVLLARLNIDILDSLASGGLFKGYSLNEIITMSSRELQQVINFSEQIISKRELTDKPNDSPVNTDESFPVVGGRYIETYSEMVAIVKECPPDRVIFSYEQYPHASHSYSLEGFISAFKPLDVQTQPLHDNCHIAIKSSKHSLDNKKTYCRELFRVALRYTDAENLQTLTKSIEGIIAGSLTDKYNPGLNAASYEVFNRFIISQGRAGK